MKKLLFTLVLSLLSFVYCPSSLNAQTIPPPYINYQAVLYDVNGANPNSPLTNQSFSTFVNINDELGNLLYREEHYASTDANGLITVKMGDGLYTAGPITNFNQIDWGVGKYYLVVDIDINGTISSTAPEQLVTVPYSYYAGKSGNGMTAVADNGNGTLTFTYANGQTYITPALSGMTGPVGPAGAQGIQGLPGTNGTNGATGQNGLNALIKTTSEAAGANCTNGGTKIETGSDANGNGVLDGGEVLISSTTFVCNGISSGGGSGAVPSGSIMAFAGSTIPIGWIICDGTEVSRVTYADLFASIATNWGQGDGTSTFNLPDLRGRFLRGVDGIAGNDPDAASRIALNSGGNIGNNVGSYQLDDLKAHNHTYIAKAPGNPYGNPGLNSGNNALQTYDTSSTGGSETRPKNAYVIYIIKL